MQWKNPTRLTPREPTFQIQDDKKNDSILLWNLQRSLSRFTQEYTGAVPPKIARKFKKASPSKKDSIPVQADEEPVQKGKRVKRSAKKSSTTPAAGIVFRETPVKTKSTGKEKVDVSRGKGIDLLSEVALAEKAQLKEVRKKSLRDFHKTHPSGSGTVAEKPPSVEKITPTVTSEGTGDKPGVPDVTEDDSTESESESFWNESEEQESDSEQDEEYDDDNQEEEETQDYKNHSTNKRMFNEIVSPLDVHVHHEVPRTQAPTLLTIPVSVITESSPVLTNIPQFKKVTLSTTWINAIEDMLLLVVQNWLKNLSGDDVADDYQNRQKKAPEHSIQRPIKDSFISRQQEEAGYSVLRKLTSSVMHVNKTSFFAEDITKISTWTTCRREDGDILEKKRAHFMNKDINKMLKEEEDDEIWRNRLSRLYKNDLQTAAKNNMT
ncbi:hypothetical protein Tco_0790718 [Tanacetum coccineum]